MEVFSFQEHPQHLPRYLSGKIWNEIQITYPLVSFLTHAPGSFSQFPDQSLCAEWVASQVVSWTPFKHSGINFLCFEIILWQFLELLSLLIHCIFAVSGFMRCLVSNTGVCGSLEILAIADLGDNSNSILLAPQVISITLHS